MLNNRKIRLMTRLAIYEKSEGKEDIRLSKYYKTDYARLNVLKTGIAVTFSYICILALVVIYKLEYLIENAVELDYLGIGKTVLGIYAAIMAVYLICALLGYSLQYSASRKKLAKYFRMLRRLKEIYREEDGYHSDSGDVEEQA